MHTPTPEAEIIIAGLVAAIRRKAPAVDGVYVYLLCLGLCILWALSEGALSMRDTMARTLRIFSGAVAVAGLVGYAGEKMRNFH